MTQSKTKQAAKVVRLETPHAPASVNGLLGCSEAMRQLRPRIERVGSSEVNVLIQGESGSGKEVVARAVHAASPRAQGPFVPINCAAIPPNLEESELFGHERGAFTGASTLQIGKIEHAHGGTLFLDEVAELSQGSQSKLLRVLQERTLQRLGGAQEIPVDFRLVAATHRSLHEEVRRGSFREDLFYRIVVLEIDVPPLREREGDVELLVSHFLRQLGPKLIGSVPTLSPETLCALEQHGWPGNVRELHNAVQHGIVSCNGEMILPSDLPSWIVPCRSSRADSSIAPARSDATGPSQAGDCIPPRLTLAELERRAIELALSRHRGKMSATARELGIARSTLYRKVKEHGIDTTRPPPRRKGGGCA